MNIIAFIIISNKYSVINKYIKLNSMFFIRSHLLLLSSQHALSIIIYTVTYNSIIYSYRIPKYMMKTPAATYFKSTYLSGFSKNTIIK